VIWKRDLTGLITPSRVLFPLGLGTALSLMGDASLYTVLPTHTAEAGIAMVQVGIILSINRLVRVFLNGPMGAAYDRSLRRGLFVGALFLGAVSTALYAATYGFWPLLVGRLLWGLAWAGIWVGGTTIILDVTTDQDRGRWTGLYQIWFFLGAALGAFVGGLLTDQIGYHAAMWAGAGVTAFGGLVALVLLPETRNVRTDTTYEKSSKPIKDRYNVYNPSNAAAWYQNPGLWVVAILQGINRFVYAGVVAATLALLVQEQISATDSRLTGPLIGVATLTGTLMAGRTVLSVLAAPLSGMLSDKLGGRWPVTIVGLILGAISMLLLSDNSPVSILTGIALGAIAAGGVQTLVTALTGDLANKNQRGRAIGLLHTAGDIGSAAGPLIAYGLLLWIGLPGVYVLCGVLLVLGAIIASGYLKRNSAG
jgi:MFS family permease